MASLSLLGWAMVRGGVAGAIISSVSHIQNNEDTTFFSTLDAAITGGLAGAADGICFIESSVPFLKEILSGGIGFATGLKQFLTTGDVWETACLAITTAGSTYLGTFHDLFVTKRKKGMIKYI